MSQVELNQISFAYSRRGPAIIEEFSMAIEAGEIVGILGPSGCGKSTLLRLIAGLESPTAGEIRIAGRTVVDERQFVQPEHRGVGMVFQDYGLFPHLTVGQNILFGLRGLSRTEQQERLREMLDLVHLKGFEGRYPHELSGGQQQRVALARALAPRPTVLLMDEPFSNLDTALRGSLRDEIRSILQATGITSLLVTHDQQDVEAICQRTVEMDACCLALAGR